MEQTSRLRILDAVELIANQIAIVSHCQEIINELMADYETEPSEKLQQQLMDQQSIMHQANTIRRMAMDSLLNSSDETDKNQWCVFKHAVWSYMFAMECSHVLWQSIDRANIQERAYMQMLQVLSMFLGVEPQLCWRCLADILTNNKKNVFKLQQETWSDASKNEWTESASITTNASVDTTGE